MATRSRSSSTSTPVSPYATLDRGQSRRATTIPAGEGLQAIMSRKTEAPPYDDLINFPRAKDKDEIRCVMCGLPPGNGCVIPRQNKDVCKECDKSTWQHVATGVYFKWCKGCKKFLRLGSFSEKLDAAKCDRCRERGRQSYLLKKGKDGGSVGNRSRSNSINSMKSDLEDLTEGIDLATAAAAMAAVAQSSRRRSCSLGGVSDCPVTLSSSDEAESDHRHGASDTECCDLRRSRRQRFRVTASTDSDEDIYRVPRLTKRPRTSPESSSVVIDDDGADVTQSKLSSVFGVPLRELTTQHSPAEEEETSTLDSAEAISLKFGGTLYELACIHQRIMTLEERAERGKTVEEKLKSQDLVLESLKNECSSLREQLMLSREREETSHEEAEKLRKECEALRERQSCLEKKEAELTLRLQEVDALSALSTVMERAHKRPRLVSLG